MNKQERTAAIERVQKAHAQAVNARRNSYMFDGIKAHKNRAELLTLLADAERENDLLQECAAHKAGCKFHATWLKKRPLCTCGLDELLKQESDNE